MWQNQSVLISETVIKCSHMVLDITSKQDVFIVLRNLHELMSRPNPPLSECLLSRGCTHLCTTALFASCANLRSQCLDSPVPPEFSSYI